MRKIIIEIKIIENLNLIDKSKIIIIIFQTLYRVFQLDNENYNVFQFLN